MSLKWFPAGRASQNEALPKKERPPVQSGELTASGRRKRKDVGARRDGAAKGWTDEEERLFLEGLDVFGREWHKAAAHVGQHLHLCPLYHSVRSNHTCTQCPTYDQIIAVEVYSESRHALFSTNL